MQWKSTSDYFVYPVAVDAPIELGWQECCVVMLARVQERR